MTGDDMAVERLREALSDLLSWFDGGPSIYGPWIIKAGPYGVDDAVTAARAALGQLESPAPHRDEAVPAEMKAWSGGDHAPNDWGGGSVMFRTSRGTNIGDVQDHPFYWRHNRVCDVIAYRPRPTVAGNAVTREAVAKRIHDSMRWAADNSCTDKHPEWIGGNSTAEDEARRAANAILALTTPPAVSDVPEGYVLMPREPTREMWAAGGDKVMGYRNRHPDKVVSDIWSAMLAAAPNATSAGRE